MKTVTTKTTWFWVTMMMMLLIMRNKTRPIRRYYNHLCLTSTSSLVPSLFRTAMTATTKTNRYAIHRIHHLVKSNRQNQFQSFSHRDNWPYLLLVFFLHLNVTSKFLAVFNDSSMTKKKARINCCYDWSTKLKILVITLGNFLKSKKEKIII